MVIIISFFNIILAVLISNVRKEKIIKNIKVRKKGMKLYLEI